MAKCWRIEELRDEKGNIPARCVKCMKGDPKMMKRLMCYKPEFSKVELAKQKRLKQKAKDNVDLARAEVRDSMDSSIK